MKVTKSFKFFVYQLTNLLDKLRYSKEPPSEEYFIYELMLYLTNYVKSAKTVGKKVDRS